MIQRQLGTTGLQVSALGFGCGAVGGLLVRGEYAEMVRTVARAVEGGVTYFDTAALYGDGVSEQNLGRVLNELKPDVRVGTKLRLAGDDFADIRSAVFNSIDASLARLQMDHVHLIQLHNSVAFERDDAREWITLDDLQIAADALREVVQAGKATAWGVNGTGETTAIKSALVGSGAQTVQTCYNLLNPSALAPSPPAFAYQDYEQFADQTSKNGVGVIAIRVLAGGALSGVPDRHSYGADRVDPIASGAAYSDDVLSAQPYRALVEGGYVDNIVEAAIRYAVFTPGISTALVGISSYNQLDDALAYTERGPLGIEAHEIISTIQNS